MRIPISNGSEAVVCRGYGVWLFKDRRACLSMRRRDLMRDYTAGTVERRGCGAISAVYIRQHY